MRQIVECVCGVCVFVCGVCVCVWNVCVECVCVCVWSVCVECVCGVCVECVCGMCVKSEGEHPGVYKEVCVQTTDEPQLSQKDRPAFLSPRDEVH